MQKVLSVLLLLVVCTCVVNSIPVDQTNSISSRLRSLIQLKTSTSVAEPPVDHLKVVSESLRSKALTAFTLAKVKPDAAESNEKTVYGLIKTAKESIHGAAGIDAPTRTADRSNLLAAIGKLKTGFLTSENVKLAPMKELLVEALATEAAINGMQTAIAGNVPQFTFDINVSGDDAAKASKTELLTALNNRLAGYKSDEFMTKLLAWRTAIPTARPLVALGNSPLWLIYACNKAGSKYLPFSGDLGSFQTDASKKIVVSADGMPTFNYVAPDATAAGHLKTYLTSIGMDPKSLASKPVTIIEFTSSGKGLASFLKFMSNWADEQGAPAPANWKSNIHLFVFRRSVATYPEADRPEVKKIEDALVKYLGSVLTPANIGFHDFANHADFNSFETFVKDQDIYLGFKLEKEHWTENIPAKTTRMLGPNAYGFAYRLSTQMVAGKKVMG